MASPLSTLERWRTVSPQQQHQQQQAMVASSSSSSSLHSPHATILPRVAAGLGQVEEMYIAMSAMEREKNDKIAHLTTEVDFLRSELKKHAAELKFMVSAVETEAQTRDAVDMAQRRETKRALFHKWRWRLERRRRVAMTNLLLDAATLAEGAVARHGEVTQRRPRELGETMRRVAEAEAALVAVRRDIVDELMSEVASTSSSSVGTTRWIDILLELGKRYDAVADARSQAIRATFALENGTAQLAGDTVAALATISGSLAALIPNDSSNVQQQQQRQRLHSSASRLLKHRVLQPKLITERTAIYDAARDPVLGFVHFATCAPLFVALEKSRADAVADGGLVAVVHRRLAMLDERLMSMPLSLRLRQAYHELQQQQHGADGSTVRTIPIRVEEVVPDLDALHAEATRPISMAMAAVAHLASPPDAAFTPRQALFRAPPAPPPASPVPVTSPGTAGTGADISLQERINSIRRNAQLGSSTTTPRR